MSVWCLCVPNDASHPNTPTRSTAACVCLVSMALRCGVRWCRGKYLMLRTTECDTLVMDGNHSQQLICWEEKQTLADIWALRRSNMMPEDEVTSTNTLLCWCYSCLQHKLFTGMWPWETEGQSCCLSINTIYSVEGTTHSKVRHILILQQDCFYKMTVCTRNE